MLEMVRRNVINQYEAAFSTLQRCIDECPDELWQQPVVNNPFSQSAFHTLFFADLYLGKTKIDQLGQAFHQEHKEIFADYEQMEDREPTGTYQKGFINEYMKFCVSKTNSVLESESAEDLNEASGFSWLKTNRLEVHIHNIRHIQHHAGQLAAVLRQSKIDVPWMRSGWTPN